MSNEKVKSKVKYMLKLHPELEGPLRSYVPEMFEKADMFVGPGSLFMRDRYRHNLYSLSYDQTQGFRIVNVTENKGWGKWAPASTELDEIGLTEWDFKCLLKKSGVGINNIKFVGGRHLSKIHNQLFNENTNEIS